ncbi:hypothetical protein [Geoglobus acetivorans]|uniref:Uncharacterized protein n=1 Tax=Geoglobus acetivorans TaxID=565033 RepID=A0ABZ3H1U7_GEOAI|nr:hypothetical protein [Geoglobus acetivorans]
MNLTFLVFLIGFVYGFVNPGRENKLRLLRNSLAVGFVFGVLIALLFFVFTLPAGLFVPFIPLLGGLAGIVAGVFIALYFGLVFIIGTFIGDVLESLLKR